MFHLSHKNVTRTALLATAVSVALVAAGCSSSPAANTASATAASDAGALFSKVPTPYQDGLTVASQGNLAPLTFVDDSGDPTGMDVELFNALSNVLGVKFTIEAPTFENMILGLESGKYDFVADTTIRADRLLKYDQLQYFTSSYSVGTLKSAAKLSSEDTSICGLRITVTAGGSIKDYINSTIDPECTAAGKDPVNVTEYPDFASEALAIQAGNADGTFADTSSFGYFMTTDGGANFQYNGPANVEASPSGFSFLKTQDPNLGSVVEDALQMIIDDGTYGEILAKYGQTQSGVTAPIMNPSV